MKTTRSLINNGATLKLMLAATCFALGSTEALAVLPADPGALLPDSIGDDADGFTAGANLIEMILQIAAIAIGAVMSFGAGYKMYNAFADKKANEDNSNFAGTIFGGLLVVAIGIGLAIGGFTYADGMAALVLGA
jgi:hypothetical protein